MRGTIVVRGTAIRRPVRPREARRGGRRVGLPGTVARPRPRHRLEPAADAHAGRAVPPLADGARASPTSTSRPLRARPAARRPCASSTSRVRSRIEPDVLMLDEMTAALPADLTERVLEVIGDSAVSDRSRHLHLAPAHRDRAPCATARRSCAKARRSASSTSPRAPRSGSSQLMLGDIARPSRGAPDGRRRRADGEAGQRGTPRIRAAACAPGPSSRTSRSSCVRARCSGVVALEGQGQDELFDILAGSERPRRGELLVDGAPGLVPSSGGRDPRRTRLRPRRPRRGAADAALRPREHRTALHRPRSAPGVRSTVAPRRRRVAGAVERLADRHACPGRGPAAVRRQPAEGDDRALGRRRRPDDALLRPDARHRHRHQAPDLRSCCASSRTPARPSSSTPPSSRRSSSPATGRSSSSAGAWWPRSPSRTPTSRRSCARPTTCRRTPRCPRRSPHPSWRPRQDAAERRMTAAADRASAAGARRRAPPSACSVRPRRNCLDARPRRLSSR